MGAARYAGFLSPFRSYLLTRLHRSTGRPDLIPPTRPHALFAHTQHYLPDVHQTGFTFPSLTDSYVRDAAPPQCCPLAFRCNERHCLPFQHTPPFPTCFLSLHLRIRHIVTSQGEGDVQTAWRPGAISKLGKISCFLNVSSTYRKPLFTEGPFRG